MVQQDRFPIRDAEIVQSLNQLSRESLQTLLVVVTFGTWLWVAGVMLLAQQHIVHAWLVLLAVLSTAWTSYLLRQQHWAGAVFVFIAGLIVAVSLITFLFPSAAAAYLYILVVLVTATLTGPLATFSVAALCVGLILILGRLPGSGIDLPDTLLPAVLTLVVATTAWLGSRRLFTALAWALTMTREAQKNAEEAQKHRGEVQRILKDLDEAYVRLERAHEALIYAREAAEKAYRFKAEFVANVSHELRTPLNLIVGFSEMMATAPESYGGVLLPSQYRGDVTAIYRSARHLSDLINDVLDLSRIEAGRMPVHKEPVDLGEVIREAIEMVRGLAEARRLGLELELPDELPTLFLDRTRIRQVLLNLLTNATRFTDAGWIRVCVRAEGPEAVVTVQDSGAGIPPDALTRAFEAFAQFDENHAREGSGLGLAVSKKFVELHGGSMWIESEVGRGTTVGFTLPIPKGEKEVPVSALKAGAPLRYYKEQPLVLVLHDDSRVLSLLSRYMDGHQFALARTVDETREKIQETLPAAVIMDTSWANRWATSASELKLPSQVPLITCPLPSLHRLGLLLGAKDYLAKPVTREDLTNALSGLPRPPRTALIVDDDPHFVRLLARMLKASNRSLRVLKAFGGKEGLEIARSQRPDVVLLDLFMPGINGYAFLEELTRDEVMARTQVIIVSVSGIEQEAAPIVGELRLGREAGFSITEMLRILQAMLSAVTPAAARSPANAATLLGAPSG